MTVRLRLGTAYDGSAFSGWAGQPGRRTVAGVLGEALATLFRAPVPMVVAGRTDAGVHAAGQVAHIDVDAAALDALAPRHLRPADERERHPAHHAAGVTGLGRRLAGLLPADLRVTAVRIAPDGFDARFSALRRHYRYRIVTTEWGVDPLRRVDTLALRHGLDPVAMQAAADSLVGLHDFAAFCKPREGASTIRDLQRLTVRACPCAGPGPDAGPAAGPACLGNSSAVLATPASVARSGELLPGEIAAYPTGAGAVLLIDVTADAFCHSMVRSLVGALLTVGGGRRPVTWPAELLRARRRTAEVAMAAAHGLTLIGVDYPDDGDLASRAEQTRAVRRPWSASPPPASL